MGYVKRTSNGNFYELATVELTQISQLLRLLRLDLVPVEAPLPLAFAHAGQVHAASATQTQYVLQGVNSRISHASAGGGDQLPVDI